jgi:hypothetical protein
VEVFTDAAYQSLADIRAGTVDQSRIGLGGSASCDGFEAHRLSTCRETVLPLVRRDGQLDIRLALTIEDQTERPSLQYRPDAPTDFVVGVPALYSYAHMPHPLGRIDNDLRRAIEAKRTRERQWVDEPLDVRADRDALAVLC